MIWKILLEGLVLSALLVLWCLIGIRRGAVGLVFLYSRAVQERCISLGLTTAETIRRRARIFRIGGLTFYLAYVMLCTYGLNGARGFASGFWQMFAILEICNLCDRLLVDAWWVGHTRCWIIPGTEDLMPYITRRDKCIKWLKGTLGMAIIAAILAAVMALLLH